MSLLAVSTVWVLQAMQIMHPTSHPYTREDVACAIAQASQEHPLFPGAMGPFRTAALLVGLAWHESNFRAKVVGDSGRSFGAFQIRPETAGVSPHELLEPKNAARVAVGLLERSMHESESAPLDLQLAVYASGRVDRGHRESKAIVALAKRVVSYD